MTSPISPAAGPAAGPPLFDPEEADLDVTLARGVLYRALSLGLRLPDSSSLSALASGAMALVEAAVLLDSRGLTSEPLVPAVRAFADLARGDASALAAVHGRLFGHSQGLVCPFETEYGTGGSFRQPQELADIAGFYLAFGLEPPAGADERVDHAACECEFMDFLACKEAFALASIRRAGIPPGEAHEMRETTRRTAAAFLRDHLGRFGLSFATRLAREDAGGFFGGLGAVLLGLLQLDCALFGVAAGPPMLELRPPALDDTPMACGSSCGTEPELIQIGRRGPP